MKKQIPFRNDRQKSKGNNGQSEDSRFFAFAGSDSEARPVPGYASLQDDK
jgi:hypothetical protein